jgi:type IV secretory pathway component VirB8
MAQNREQDQTEHKSRLGDENVWRAIHYLDPDRARDRHYLTLIFGSLAFVIAVFAITAWGHR